MVFDIRGIQVATDLDLYVEAFSCEMPLVTLLSTIQFCRFHT
jgi:hypothetical protein